MKKILMSFVAALAFACAAGALTGCAGDREHRSTGEMLDDATIKTKVKAALVNDPEVAGMSIDVTVDRGDVQLGGWVKNASERKKAEDITWGVKGVRSVKNNLEIK
jgi:hyperosmotically inducible periplasmic protein